VQLQTEGSEEGCSRLNSPGVQEKKLQLAQSSSRQNPLEAVFWSTGTEERWAVLKDNLLNPEQSRCARKHASMEGGQFGCTWNC